MDLVTNLEAHEYCKMTDSLPFRCDFLERNLENFAEHAVVVLVLTSFLLILPILEDLDQASEEWRLWLFRQRSRRAAGQAERSC